MEMTEYLFNYRHSGWCRQSFYYVKAIANPGIPPPLILRKRQIHLHDEPGNRPHDRVLKPVIALALLSLIVG